MPQQETNYYQLNVGYEFPPSSYNLDSSVVTSYLEATQESHGLYRKEGLVPPMAIGAFAMASLSSAITFPSGTVHVSQEFDFLGLIRVDDKITCYSRVSRNIYRGGMYLMSTDLTAVNQNQEKVLTGKVGFVLPKPDGDIKQP